MRLNRLEGADFAALDPHLCWSEQVVRDRIELSTFRFSGVRMTVQGSPCRSIWPAQSPGSRR
jgi:hypothetical protein